MKEWERYFRKNWAPYCWLNIKKKKTKMQEWWSVTTSLDTLIAYLGILEGKNEIETDKNDPTIQEALYYRDYWSQDNVCIN